jgi:hypothetical protein
MFAPMPPPHLVIRARRESPTAARRSAACSRDEGTIGEAEIAQPIENGHIPPLDELLARDDRGELP